jgi:hypothetical protein
MNKVFQRSSIAAAACACALTASAPAHAVLIATICNDIQCLGGDDVIVQDNLAGDSIAMVGAINFTTSLFGYTLVVNTSQSKPVVGSATAPQLDLTFAATSSGAAGNIFMYVSDTDFTTSGAFNFTIGGTNSGIDGSVTGRAWGGTSNSALQFSGANLISTLGPFTTAAYSGNNTGTFNAGVNPYSLTIGTQISRTAGGTSTGDLNLQVSAVPESSTWALMLMGPALIGFVARRRSADAARRR